jgi:cell division cycle 14
MLANPKLQDVKIFHYTSTQPSKRANSALLMGAFQIIMLNRSADEACGAFQNVDAFMPYVDASYHPSSFELYIEDCLKGLEKAMKLGWFDMNTFNSKDYEYLSSVETGGLNWMIPSKLLAFVCPASERSSKYPALTPEQYSSLFKSINVTDVVRLNNKTYEAERFTKFSINHWELYFLDGSVPNESIVNNFIEIVDRAQGAVAVHCKAGLGRTATLIGCYAIKYHGFTGLEFIGWARLCRPGSVLGPQQQFLCDRFEISQGRVPKTLTPQEDKFKARFGDYGQSSRLLGKAGNSTGNITKNKVLIKNTFSNTAKIASLKNLKQKK